MSFTLAATHSAPTPEPARVRKPRTPITKCTWLVTAADVHGVVHTRRIWGRTDRKPSAATELRFWRVGHGIEFPADVVVTVEQVAS